MKYGALDPTFFEQLFCKNNVNFKNYLCYIGFNVFVEEGGGGPFPKK